MEYLFAKTQIYFFVADRAALLKSKNYFSLEFFAVYVDVSSENRGQIHAVNIFQIQNQ